MAITLGAASGAAMLRITWEDIKGERMISVIPLDVAATDQNVIDVLTAFEVLSNAKIVEAALQTSRLAAGLATAASADAQNLVAARAFVTFEKANPLNANKVVAKTIQIPAYVDALYEDGALDTDNATLTSLIGILDDILNYQGVDEVWYPDDWSFVLAHSGFGTVPSRTDGQ